MTGRGDVRTLRAGYERWKTAYAYNGGDRKLILPLQYSKGRSARFTRAQGQATLDLVDGSLSVVVSGLSDQDGFDLWLIDNRSGRGQNVKPEAGDLRVRVGSLKHEGGTATLQARLGREMPAGFEIDLMVVARSGEDPRAAGLLFGSPSLFQRVYYSEQRGQPAARVEGPAGLLSAPFSVLIPSPAYAAGTAGATDLEALIARGRDIFLNETFNGNGRTCGSCHPEQNNFTLDPRFIATLPPTDPLFVAEFNPALAVNFENPTLMRNFGLILENVDGVDDLKNKFVMRGVPHTLALSTSLEPAPEAGLPAPDGKTPRVDGTITPPFQRTGWGGDGAPGGGTLREFATGAVRQHFTQTLSRVEGVDFRLPTEDELNALEAFQLSLGRQVDEELQGLKFKNALAAEGQRLFFGEEKCNLCHRNAGASAEIASSSAPGAPLITSNANFNTGVEDLDLGPGRPAGSIPRDGGFGREFDVSTGGFGNGTFNTPPLVEAADTGPFFHNNAVVTTIEDAVRFYGTRAFNDSSAGQLLKSLDPEGLEIEVGDDEARAIGAFLRVINARENIRSSIALNERAQDAYRLDDVLDLLRLSISEINDAIGVLRGAGLHPGARLNLRAAREFVEVAANIRLRFIRNIFIRLAIDEAKAARRRMVEN
jgi:cytochrome c peroxidase